MMEEDSAQGSLEILLLVGGAIILAGVVGLVIKSIYNTGASPLVHNARNKVLEEI